MSHYEKAWQAVSARIDVAVQNAGRPAGSVRLLAVSKTFPAEAVRAVYAAGQRAFGENKVQEGAAKRQALADLRDVEWHLIGPLQTNKSRAAAASFDWVESVDRLKIAQRLSAQRPQSKSGVVPDEALALARGVAELPRLRLRGIMGIPAPTDDVAQQRAQFRRLRQCFEQCMAAGLAVDTLSMGMSGDLEAAVAEGATQVRIGTAIFGAR
jgi:PLP dependent protein